MVSGPKSVLESELQGSERLLFVATPLMTPSRAIKGKLDNRSREQKQRNISVTMFVLIRCDWGGQEGGSSASACDLDSLVFVRS